jgi:hypothetical protein
MRPPDVANRLLPMAEEATYRHVDLLFAGEILIAEHQHGAYLSMPARIASSDLAIMHWRYSTAPLRRRIRGMSGVMVTVCLVFPSNMDDPDGSPHDNQPGFFDRRRLCRHLGCLEAPPRRLFLFFAELGPTIL